MSARGDNMLDVSSSQGDPEALRKAAEAVKVLEDRIVAIAQGAGAASALVRLTVGVALPRLCFCRFACNSDARGRTVA